MEYYVAYVAVVRAADRAGAAATTTCTNDSDGTAGETNIDIQILQDNAQEAKEPGGGRRVSLKYIERV